MLIADFPQPVPGNAAKVAGIGLLRYWAKPGGSSVVIGLSGPEIADYTAQGVPFGTIFEDGSASWMAGGYAAGQTAGRWLLSQFAATGHTPSCVYLAADSNTLATSAVNACCDGAASVLGPGIVGLYAYLPQLQSAHDGGHATRFWLTGHFPAGSIAEMQAAYPWINAYQCQGSQPAGIPTTITVAGQLGDVDIPLQQDWGQGGDMPTIDEFVAAMKFKVLAADDFRFDGRNMVDLAREELAAAGRIEVKLDALAKTLSDDEVAIIAAVRAQQGGDPAAFAAILGPILAPLIHAGATPEQVQAAATEGVRLALAKAVTP